MAYNITLEGKNKVIAERMLKSVVDILHKCKINYWLEGGTLLGIIREDRLLPWDNDVDLSLMVSESHKLDSFYKALKQQNFRVKFRYFEHSTSPFTKGDLRMIKLREKRFFGLVKGPVCVDIFIKYPKDDMAFWEIDNKIKSVPLKFYQHFKRISFKGQEYNIPKDTEGYLTYRYGEWETPVKDWNTSRDDKALS